VLRMDGLRKFSLFSLAEDEAIVLAVADIVRSLGMGQCATLVD